MDGWVDSTPWPYSMHPCSASSSGQAHLPSPYSLRDGTHCCLIGASHSPFASPEHTHIHRSRNESTMRPHIFHIIERTLMSPVRGVRPMSSSAPRTRPVPFDWPVHECMMSVIMEGYGECIDLFNRCDLHLIAVPLLVTRQR